MFLEIHLFQGPSFFVIYEFPGCMLGDAVYGRNPANQLRLVVYPIIYKVFLHHPRWLAGFSSINSMTMDSFF